MTTSKSGRDALSRRPISSNPAASLLRWPAGIVSQTRAMIGPWLAAKTPTRSAMGALFAFLEGVQARDELGFRHAADLEVEPQEIGVDERRERGDVVFQQRLADVRPDFVAADDGGHVGTIFRCQLAVVLQVEEQFAHPVVGHRRSLPLPGLSPMQSCPLMILQRFPLKWRAGRRTTLRSDMGAVRHNTTAVAYDRPGCRHPMKSSAPPGTARCAHRTGSGSISGASQPLRRC